jgi:hypothetical protein
MIKSTIYTLFKKKSKKQKAKSKKKETTNRLSEAFNSNNIESDAVEPKSSLHRHNTILVFPVPGGPYCKNIKSIAKTKEKEKIN